MFQDIYATTFYTHFHDIDDQRIERTKFHLLHDILVIAICAVICGADGPSAIEQYALAKQDWLKTFLKLLIDIPATDTIGRLLAQVDLPISNARVRRWIEGVWRVSPGWS